MLTPCPKRGNLHVMPGDRHLHARRSTKASKLRDEGEALGLVRKPLRQRVELAHGRGLCPVRRPSDKCTFQIFLEVPEVVPLPHLLEGKTDLHLVPGVYVGPGALLPTSAALGNPSIAATFNIAAHDSPPPHAVAHALALGAAPGAGRLRGGLLRLLHLLELLLQQRTSPAPVRVVPGAVPTSSSATATVGQRGGGPLHPQPGAALGLQGPPTQRRQDRRRPSRRGELHEGVAGGAAAASALGTVADEHHVGDGRLGAEEVGDKIRVHAPLDVPDPKRP
mmetsp:Transcript_48247/g.138571  ORF Transcript_48247/g.138571 Transcript_48247/m.138571 type:complete len:279 (+) Transcript_48247:87-923(+)